MKRSIFFLLLFLVPTFVHADFPPETKVGGFAIGPQMWSFRLFTFAEGAFKAKQAGCSVLEAYPGQALSPQDSTPFDHNATPAQWAQAKLILQQTGVRLVNYGVVGWQSDQELENIFVFAKLMGIPAITVEPGDHSAATWDKIESLIKKYDIKVGIHNHPKRPNDPSYVYWNPDEVLKMVEGRDERLGLACDTGHWLRSGVDPLQAIKKAKGRIISVHLKDLNVAGKEDATDVPYGQGVANINAILKELKRQGFDGNVSIEYETNWENNLPEIKECVDYVRQAGKPF